MSCILVKLKPMTTFRWMPCLVLLCMSPLFAQVSAVVSGTVTDPSGAVVPSAAVIATNTETGAVRETISDGAGRYQMSLLPVGSYEIHAKKERFQEAVRTGIQLAVNQSATVDLALQVGESSQQITVNEDAPLVGVSTSDASGVINQLQLRDLPLNARSFDLLITLDPGVINFTWEKIGGTGVSNSTNGNNFVVEGNRPQQNLFLLNGVEFTGAAKTICSPVAPAECCWASTPCASSMCCAIRMEPSTEKGPAAKCSS